MYNKKEEIKRHLYEMIINNEKCIMYLDIDCPLNKLKIEEETLIIIIKKILKNLFIEFYDILINLDKDVLILKSSNTKKLSLHILIRCENKEIVFENNIVIGQLINFAVNNIESSLKHNLKNRLFDLNENEQNGIFYLNDKGLLTCVIDTKVYTRNRLFRTLGSCKKGRSDVFKFIKTPSWIERDEYTLRFKYFNQI